MVDYIRRLKQRILKIEISGVYDSLLYLIILTAPLLVYGVLVSIFNLRLSRIFILLIAPFLLLKIIKKPNLIMRDNFLLFGFLPFLLYSTVSIAWSRGVSVGTGLQRLGGLYEIIAIYIIMIMADLNAEKVIKFVKCYVLSALIPLGVSAWQVANNIWQFSSSEIPFTKFVIVGKYTAVLERGYLQVGGGASRLSATFAEPTIFGCFLCSVLLLSLMLEFENYFLLILLRLFQILGVIVMVLSLTKLALISFVAGIIVLTVINKKYILELIAFFSILVIVVCVMDYFNVLFLMNRLVRETGHYRLLLESLEQMKKINLVLGEGIGSIPHGSLHRFLLSRIYESGIIGLIFALLVSIIPINLLLLKMSHEKSIKVKNICIGALFALLLGLHLYDYFIHLFPWIVIGATMSFYNNENNNITMTNGNRL